VREREDVTDSWWQWVFVRYGCVTKRATVLAHAAVFRRRWLFNNQISTIANGTFAGLTALQTLYVTGL
jgi:hypothetical protein